MARQRLRLLQDRLGSRRIQGEQRAGELESEVDRRRMDFDASDAARAHAGAAFEDFQEDFSQGIADLRGQQVGMGRLDTGFATGDEDRLGEDFNRRLSREIARGAFSAASLDLSNIGGIQAAGVEARAGADAALAGDLDRTQAAVNERKRRRRGLLGTLGGVVGGIAGTVFGPAGTAIGSRLGGWAAGKVGS
jgi:hypothetical protein